MPALVDTTIRLLGQEPRAGRMPTAAVLRLAEVLDRLPPAQREAFEMLQLEGLSVAAAAARVGITTGALKVRAHRAYKALRALLENRFGRLKPRTDAALAGADPETLDAWFRSALAARTLAEVGIPDGAERKRKR